MFPLQQAVDADPFIDDSVTMAKRLKGLGRTVGLDVLPGKFDCPFEIVKIETLQNFFYKIRFFFLQVCHMDFYILFR